MVLRVSLALGALAVLAHVVAADPWWKNAVVYQVYPRSFKDSDGDGIGDLEGIRSKLQHLKDIGVDAVWLSPIYPSPQADFGYDISDYRGIDKLYGTLEDFKRLKDTAHSLGLKVVLDIVPNHSSNEHPWFIASENGEEKYKDYYVWRRGEKNSSHPHGYNVPNNWNSVFRFSAWEWSEKRQSYYLHQFAKQQPDLNYENKDVVEEIKDVYKFWMDQGVDGFRVDAVPYLFETGNDDEPRSYNPNFDEFDNDYYIHTVTKDQPKTYDMIQQWREVVDKHDNEGNTKDRLLMTEAYASLEKTIQYYGTKERPGPHFTFNFQLITQTDKSSNATVFKKAIDEWMAQMGDWRWPNWVIGNHDNSRAATRFPELADAMNMLALTLPGTAMTYNGEELGMTDTYITWAETLDPQGINKGEKDYLKVSRDPCRTPFQWDDSTSAGFSSNRKTWLPVNPNYYYLNVEAQKKAVKSHYSIFKTMTRARKNYDTLLKGKLETAVVGEQVLRVTRSVEEGRFFILLINFGSTEITLSADTIGEGRLEVVESSLNSELSSGQSMEGASTFVLVPHAAVAFRSGSAATTASVLLVAICLLLRW